MFVANLVGNYKTYEKELNIGKQTHLRKTSSIVVTEAPNEVIPSESLFSSRYVYSSSYRWGYSVGIMLESSADMFDCCLASGTIFCTHVVIRSTSHD